MQKLTNVSQALLAVSLLCGTAAANAATEGVSSPLLGKSSAAVALNDSTMDKVVGSGSSADSYGYYAQYYYYQAYAQAWYGRYSYTSGSQNSAASYAMAGYYAGFASAYSSLATYYAAYNY